MTGVSRPVAFVLFIDGVHVLVVGGEVVRVTYRGEVPTSDPLRLDLAGVRSPSLRAALRRRVLPRVLP